LALWCATPRRCFVPALGLGGDGTGEPVVTFEIGLAQLGDELVLADDLDE